MAFINQDDKKRLMPEINQVCKEYGMKCTVSIRHHMVLVVTLKSSNMLDFTDHNGGEGINHYWLERSYSGLKLDFLQALKDAMNQGNHDNSDIMTDYFDVGWYIEIKAGTYNKPFVLTGNK